MYFNPFYEFRIFSLPIVGYTYNFSRNFNNLPLHAHIDIPILLVLVPTSSPLSFSPHELTVVQGVGSGIHTGAAMDEQVEMKTKSAKDQRPSRH